MTDFIIGVHLEKNWGGRLAKKSQHIPESGPRLCSLELDGGKKEKVQDNHILESPGYIY